MSSYQGQSLMNGNHARLAYEHSTKTSLKSVDDEKSDVVFSVLGTSTVTSHTSPLSLSLSCLKNSFDGVLKVSKLQAYNTSD